MVAQVVVDNTGFGDWERELIRGENKKLIDCRENAHLISKLHPTWKGKIGFDEFAQRVVLRGKVEIPGFPEGEWTTRHDLNFGLWCAQNAVTRCLFKSEKSIAQGVWMTGSEKSFHPVREWVESLRWDEVPRLDHWLVECMGVPESEYSRLVGRFFMLNLVARPFDPGCICRSVIVLEGKQLRGKSEALRALAQPWFSDSHLDLGNKDSFLQIQGVLLYEIQEMHAFSRADVALVKQFISSREDNFRPPYAARNVRLRRQVVISGTTNESLYMRDWTGNTRLHPVRIDPAGIDVDKVAAWREQLFAEAFLSWKKQERRYPTREEEEKHFAPEQDERLIEHPWKAIVSDWLDSATGPTDMDRVTTVEILTLCLKFERSKIVDTHEQTIGRIMSGLGWSRKRASGGKRGYFYERPKQ